MSQLFQTAEAARREAIKTLLAEVKRTAPAWSRVPPWMAEQMFERARQRELFELENSR